MNNYTTAKQPIRFCPHCGKSYYKELYTEVTCMGWAPVYKYGVLMNDNPNTKTVECQCLECGKMFTYKSKV